MPGFEPGDDSSTLSPATMLWGDVQKIYKLLRFLCPLIVVFSVFIANASSASAADSITFYDYRDFETSYYIDGENDIVYVDLPSTWFYYKIKSFNGVLKEGYLGSEKRVYVHIPNGGTTYFQFFPFGTPFDLQFSGGSTILGNFLEIDDLPEGSIFYYSIEYSSVWASSNFEFNYDSTSSSIYVDDSGKVLSEYDNESGAVSYTYSEHETVGYTNVIHQVGGAKGFAFGHQPISITFNNPAAGSSNSFQFNLVSVQLILSIPSLYRQREQGELTNGLLQEILNALDASSGGASGEFNNNVGGVTGELGSLGDQLSGVDRPAAGDINTDISDYVDLSSNKQVYGVFDVLWQSPMILSMLMITLTLVTCSYVLFGKKG